MVDLLAVLTKTPKRGKVLSRELDINEAQLRSAVHALRCEGHPICSGWSGYHIGTPEDVKESIRMLRGRAASLEQAAKGLERSQQTRSFVWHWLRKGGD